jgi:hypothetical protein
VFLTACAIQVCASQSVTAENAGCLSIGPPAANAGVDQKHVCAVQSHSHMLVLCWDVVCWSLAAAIFGLEALTHWWWLLACSAVTVSTLQLRSLAVLLCFKCHMVARGALARVRLLYIVWPDSLHSGVGIKLSVIWFGRFLANVLSNHLH